MTAPRAPTTVYPSKRDWWIEILLLLAAAGTAAAAAGVWFSPESLGVRVGMTVVSAATAAFVLWVLYGTAYTLTDEQLVVRSGPLRWTVPLAAIEEVFPTHNPLSAPACSLDRLHIRRNDSRRWLLISPDAKAAFLRDLAVRSPGLTVEGDRLVRRRGAER